MAAAKTQATQATKEAKSKPAQPKQATASAVKPKRAAKATQPKAAQPKQATATAAKPGATAAKAPAKAKPQAQGAPSRTLHVKGVSTKAAKPQAAPKPPPSKPKAAAKLPAPLTLTRVGDYDNPTVDPAMIAPPEIIRVMQGSAKTITHALRTGAGYTAFSARKSKRRGYNDVALHWHHNESHGTSDYVLETMYPVGVDWTRQKVLIGADVQAQDIAELDLAGGTLTRLNTKEPPRERMRSIGYLAPHTIFISQARSLSICERHGNNIRTAFTFANLFNSGFATINGKLLFGGLKFLLLLGLDGADIRQLWRGAGEADSPREYNGKFRFYADDGCFELAGAEQLWEDCFVNGNREKYPIFQGV